MGIVVMMTVTGGMIGTATTVTVVKIKRQFPTRAACS